jgi:hypothetical protein
MERLWRGEAHAAVLRALATGSDRKRQERKNNRCAIQGFSFMPGKYALSGACSRNSVFSTVMIPNLGFDAVPELDFVNETP